MKTCFLAVISFCLVALSFTSCKKDDAKKESYKCTTCTSAPEAKAANDASSKGIYKGLVIGSTGTIKFDIQNDASVIKAYLTIDGAAVELTASVSWQAGVSYVAPFTGSMNGQSVTIDFSVDVNGGNPMVTSSDIPGHPNAQFVLIKETSNALVECFEGTYHNTLPEDGTFNIIISRSLAAWEGIARENGDSEADEVGGTLNGNKIIEDNGTELGTLNNDEISGSFQDSDGNTVTIKGKRTL